MTKEMVKALFPATKNIDEVVGIIDTYRGKFGVNTNIRLAMFLAQVREEIGEDFKVLRENLNYSSDALTKVYKVFNQKLANNYGRTSTQKANQEVIANLAYANKLGNGNADSDNDGDMDKDDDGFKYRGAGCLQITGKGNFQEVQKRCLKHTGKEMNPDTLEGFIVFGLAFWLWKDLYLLADTLDIDKVTVRINKYTDSYDRRREHFNKIKGLING